MDDDRCPNLCEGVGGKTIGGKKVILDNYYFEEHTREVKYVKPFVSVCKLHRHCRHHWSNMKSV